MICLKYQQFVFWNHDSQRLISIMQRNGKERSTAVLINIGSHGVSSGKISYLPM